MANFLNNYDSTTTTSKGLTFCDFIVYNGYYPQFLAYCRSYPQVKSRNKLAVMFLRHINVFNIAKAFVKFGIKTYKDVKDVKVYEL